MCSSDDQIRGYQEASTNVYFRVLNLVLLINIHEGKHGYAVIWVFYFLSLLASSVDCAQKDLQHCTPLYLFRGFGLRMM